MNACIEARDVFRHVRMKTTGYAIVGSRKIGGGKRKELFAHRRGYEEAFGPIPDGMHIHHTCENKSCVNPAHLVAMTPAQHKQAHRASHCQRGHAMVPENIRKGGGCRQCGIEANRARVPTLESRARKAETDRARYARPEVRARKAEQDRIRHARRRSLALHGGEKP